jgi:hypothetical protein
MPKFCLSASLFLFCAMAAGCDADKSATVSGVDDSVVHTEEQMQELEAQNASDMRSE